MNQRLNLYEQKCISLSERYREKAAYPDLVPFVIGQDGVAIIANKKNPIENISASQVLEIYAGKITNWNDLGGDDLKIDPAGILLHHGTAEVFMKFIGLEAEEQGEGVGKVICYWKKGDDKKCDAKVKGVDGNQPSCAAVMTKPGAISFASIGFAQSLADKGAPIKLFKLNGVEATAANVVSGCVFRSN